MLIRYHLSGEFVNSACPMHHHHHLQLLLCTDYKEIGGSELVSLYLDKKSY